VTELDEILAARGFDHRAAQDRLYEHLIQATPEGVIAQAGTGTGKSMGILAAAANRARLTGEQSIIVTPTLTLMNQYRDGDTPWAIKAYDDLEFAEIRGMAHYQCEQTSGVQRALSLEYKSGCMGLDAGCTQTGWEGHTDGCLEGCLTLHGGGRWVCGYREARYRAHLADVVVTNADMLIVNDRILYELGRNFLSLEGSLYIDEAHTLEQKLRDYASRSLFHGSVKRFAYAQDAAQALSKWIERQERNLAIKDTSGFPDWALREIANAPMPALRPGDGLTKQREVQEACGRIVGYLAEPHDSAVLHVGQGSLKMDWINIAKSSGELLTTRSFGLVSATIPGSMGSVLGVPNAPFTDVGHPFDYASQAWLGFSAYGGDYKSAQHDSNFEQRANEVLALIRRAKGGALILFSSFKDLERLHEHLRGFLRQDGLKVLVQDRDMEAKDRQKLAEDFKADGNAVLFGSESFATGFDVPGNALRLVVVWKLPYPAVDPVSNAIRSNSFPRYNDIMKVRAVQAIGRLIRTDSDQGIVWVADGRGRRLLDRSDPLTSHLPEFARL
jgi:Rad3-related DNA helicase